MSCLHCLTMQSSNFSSPNYQAMISALSSFLVFFLLPWSVVAQSRGVVSVGDSLTADNNATPWLSPSEHFAFGFRLLDKTNLYLLAIWYYKIPDKTIVWYANGDNPAPIKSKVELTVGGLVLTNPQGGEIWKSPVSSGEATYGVLNDTGNFVVAGANSEKLWQSFDYPTDTLLPTQIIPQNRKGLSSRLTETNFSQGRFQFRLIPDGNVVLNTNNLLTGFAYDAYFWSNTVDTNKSNAGIQVVFNESGYLYVLRASNVRESLTPGRVVPATENYHRATLNFDGVFILYSHPKNFTGGGNWSVFHTMPDNICTAIRGRIGTGSCGFNAICTLDTDKRPNCKCPGRFSLLDPDDPYGGCKPDFPIQSCEENLPNASEDFDLEELNSVDWPENDYEMYTPYNIEDCKKACLEDCFCSAAVFRVGTCWKKKLPLSNGRQDVDVNGKSFVKVRKGNFTPRPLPPFPYNEKSNDTLVLVVSLLLGGSVFFNFMLVGVAGFCFLIYQHRHKRSPQVERAIENNLRSFSYKELVEATNAFKEELGRGSFGVVFKGLAEIGSSRVPIAIKKLDRVVQESEKEFKAEVMVIGQTHHKNLVRLIGFCNEEQHRLLVYELLTNGNLANFLFGDIKLSWNQRSCIALGVARGLFYLHEECSSQIIHCDIKPQNILLDDHYEARISDFGLAKLLFVDQSQTHTAIRGTKGYVAPEWFKNKPVTVKVDVYSFGILLLEIICCRKRYDPEVAMEKACLCEWAYDCYREGKIDALVEHDEEALNDMKMAERFVMVAIWCIQEEPYLRPTMKMVMLMLEGIIQVPAPPCPCPDGEVTRN